MTEPTLEQYAALACALAIARGALSSVAMGGHQIEEVEMALQGTSLANIAAVLGQSESDLAIDWNAFLSPDQKRTLQGCTDG